MWGKIIQFMLDFNERNIVYYYAELVKIDNLKEAVLNKDVDGFTSIMNKLDKDSKYVYATLLKYYMKEECDIETFAKISVNLKFILDQSSELNIYDFCELDDFSEPVDFTKIAFESITELCNESFQISCKLLIIASGSHTEVSSIEKAKKELLFIKKLGLKPDLSPQKINAIASEEDIMKIYFGKSLSELLNIQTNASFNTYKPTGEEKKEIYTKMGPIIMTLNLQILQKLKWQDLESLRNYSIDHAKVYNFLKILSDHFFPNDVSTNCTKLAKDYQQHASEDSNWGTSAALLTNTTTSYDCINPNNYDDDSTGDLTIGGDSLDHPPS